MSLVIFMNSIVRRTTSLKVIGKALIPSFPHQFVELRPTHFVFRFFLFSSDLVHNLIVNHRTNA